MSGSKVFICHNSKDKPVVKDIEKKLRQQGLETWMDEKHIQGFEDWKKYITQNIIKMDAIAVFLGSSGFGEWQKDEIRTIYDEISRRKEEELPQLRVGLVILKNCRPELRKIQEAYHNSPQGWLFDYQTVDLRKPDFSIRKLVVAITGEPWQGNDSNNFLNHNVDYTQLQTSLAKQKWKEADKETLTIMLKATGRRREGWLDYPSIENFPSPILNKIDQLWIEHSDGHFGFSAQKRIWESVSKNPKQFGELVGWGYEGWWLFGGWYKYSDVCFDILSAPEGHLPIVLRKKRVGVIVPEVRNMMRNWRNPRQISAQQWQNLGSTVENQLVEEVIDGIMNLFDSDSLLEFDSSRMETLFSHIVGVSQTT
ncbi:GUN4 domain-containing protein [Tolypothrix sp. VBCCA 56010]|uniref:GUN4 domain-containing protein n=1 Tax=Tolypothrix sp. VBCCA 56010 TaxID=3137731 RepID=UPI003D7F0A62